MLAATVILIKLVWTAGDRDEWGVATPGEAERLLGVTRLSGAAGNCPTRPVRKTPAGVVPMIFNQAEVGGIWPGPRTAGGELWVPWDRTAGVIGPQGSGKTPIS